MSRVFARLSITALLLAGIALPRTADANCEYPRSQTTTFYAWVFSNYPPSCSGCNVGSPICNALTWQAIGQITIECDGTITSWGDTTSCTGADNTTYTTASCPPVCD
jgi:hypothetical protein